MSRKAFTLMEMVVVALVIGVLAAVAIPTYKVHINRVRVAEGVQTLVTLRDAQLRYKTENGAYATTLAQLDVDIPASQNFQAPTVSDQSAVAGIRSNWSGVCFELSIDENGVVGCTDDAAGGCGTLNVDEICPAMGNLVGVVH